jgi:threonine dehydratase
MIGIPDEAQRVCRHTPLIFVPPLGAWLKLESLQATGSFKLRGAAVKLARLGAHRAVVAASAGNHGLGVALAAQRMAIAATVIVSAGAARVKREGIARLGAEVRRSDGDYQQAEREARALADERGHVFISPFDDDDVIDGNGRWLAAELRADRPSLRRVIVPVGGGGLAGGLAEALVPSVRVIGVQPELNCAMRESLAGGHALTRYDGGATMCEGLEGPVAERTYALCARFLEEIVTVSEAETLTAIAFAYRALGIVVEPSAAVAIAAARAGRVSVDAETAIVITGGNIDDEVLARALSA